jgi:hypothetical protein
MTPTPSDTALSPPATAIPTAALTLGIAGLVPFVGLAGIIVLNRHLPAADAWRALTLYGAVILSFMGGVHWGAALATGAASRFLASVVPALAAWFATAFLPPRPATAALAIGFALLLLFDLAEVRRGHLPAWYAPLRRGLTGVVILSLAAALLATWR